VSAPPEGPLIQLQAVQREFHVGGQTVHALRGVDLTVARGEYLAIMGPSGSGKSTLLNMIGLLDRPDAGRYLFEGRELSKLSEEEQAAVRRERIGFVFQFFHLVPRLTAFQNIELPLVLAGIPAAQRQPRVDELLAAFGLEQRGHHRPEELSGGQRQRVAIARAMAMEPSLLLADEPTGNLDRASGGEVVNLLEGLQRRGITLVVVTHDPELGGRARRRIHMVDGAIASDETE